MKHILQNLMIVCVKEGEFNSVTKDNFLCALWKLLCFILYTVLKSLKILIVTLGRKKQSKCVN